MTQDLFVDLNKHFLSVADELRAKAQQASVLSNTTNIGTEREEVYRTFLERHLPKSCDVFLGGYIFDRHGNRSKQIDVIATSGHYLRFQMSSNRYISTLEGAIAIAEIKSNLNKEKIHESLDVCASIPTMPDPEGIIAPFLKVNKEGWQDMPFSIVFAYDGISPQLALSHINAYYNDNSHIPVYRRPNVIHVLEKYVILRTTGMVKVYNRDGSVDENQPAVGEYSVFDVNPDVSALAWIIMDLQSKAILNSNLFIKFGDWYNNLIFGNLNTDK